MKSIRSRIALSYFLMIALLWLCIGAISIFYVHTAISRHSASSMRFLLQQKISELDTAFDGIAQNVQVLSSFAASRAEYDDAFYSELKEKALLALGD